MPFLTSEVMDLINRIEDNFPVCCWKVDGVEVWPLVRFRLNTGIFRHDHTGSAPVAQSRCLSDKIASRLFVWRGWLAANAADPRGRGRESRCDALFLSDGVSFSNCGGVWYERFCDPLIEMLARKGYQSSLFTLGQSYLVPRHTPSRFLQPRLALLQAGAILKARFSRGYGAHLPAYREVAHYLEEQGSPVGLPEKGELYRQVCEIAIYRRYFERLLDRMQPAVAFLVSYYGLEGLAFNMACRGRGIPSIDIQHGLQGEHHAAYGRWHRVPAGGYPMLPSHFWCWTQADAGAIAAWSGQVAGFHRPMVGGNLWLELWKKGDSPVMQECRRRIEQVKGRLPGRRHAMLTLQPGLEDEEALRPVLEAMRQGGRKWCWWVRLHPCSLTSREQVRLLLDRTGLDGIELELSSELPLYALLPQMDVHLTHSSSAVIEAMTFGVPSVIFSSFGSEFFTELIAQGWVVEDSSDVLAAMQRQIARRPLLREEVPAAAGDAAQSVLAMLAGRRRDGRGKVAGGTA